MEKNFEGYLIIFLGFKKGCRKKGTRAAVKWFLTSLFRNFFTDLRKASVDMPKPRLASSISQSANGLFLHFLFKKKMNGEET